MPVFSFSGGSNQNFQPSGILFGFDNMAGMGKFHACIWAGFLLSGKIPDYPTRTTAKTVALPITAPGAFM